MGERWKQEGRERREVGERGERLDRAGRERGEKGGETGERAGTRNVWVISGNDGTKEKWVKSSLSFEGNMSRGREEVSGGR